jgi:hypothetical protein
MDGFERLHPAGRITPKERGGGKEVNKIEN